MVMGVQGAHGAGCLVFRVIDVQSAGSWVFRVFRVLDVQGVQGAG